MDSLSYKTKFINNQTADKKWVIVDAKDAVVGRFSSQVAMILRGKNKPSYTPHIDCGDNVIVINAEKIRFTGKKLTDKQYVRYTNYPGGQRFQTPKEVIGKYPKRVIENSVRGMLPKNRLGRELFRNLYVYEGTEHPHAAQKPTEVKF